MAINTELKLKWRGDDYKLKVTMEVIDRVEDQINVMRLVQQVSDGDFRMAKIAKLLSVILVEAGCDTDQEDVYLGMTGGGDVSVADVMPMLGTIWEAFYPNSKKKSTDKVKPKAKARKATQKRSTKR